MKRTKSINQEMFRKSWRSYPVAPLALAISAVFMLTGCEKSDETVAMYQNADDCSRSNPSMREQCTTTYHNALKEAEKTAPKYATREDCVAEFGDAQCTQAPAQAGMAAGSQSSGSVWMPLMAGYMMGRMMGGLALLSSRCSPPKTLPARPTASSLTLPAKVMARRQPVGALRLCRKPPWPRSLRSPIPSPVAASAKLSPNITVCNAAAPPPALAAWAVDA